MKFDKDQVFAWLSEVLDPEVPVLDIVSMGMVRDAIISGDEVTVVATPTYSGCPALTVIEEAICEKLFEKGARTARVDWKLAPPWTTDWITPEAKRKLELYGIAPPEHGAENLAGADSIVPFSNLTRRPVCPRCCSLNTRITSEFGSTACKALCRCDDCCEPFEYFKPH